MELLEYLYSDNFNNFEQWFQLVKNNEEVYPRHRIPFQEWLDEYITEIESKSEEEVKELLRYLLLPYTRGIDESNYRDYMRMEECIEEYSGIEEFNDRIKDWQKSIIGFKQMECFRRIENGQDAWEGLTWILQLLPYFPYKAIKALTNYFDAEIGQMPDDRIIGVQQCIAIIEAKFIKSNEGLENYLLKLKPRQFEYLINNLYKNMGYETEITPATRDGGKDVIAKINREDGKETVYVECKLYKTSKLRLSTVRDLYGVIQKDNINRGVVFCTGYVNQSIRESEERIQVWDLEQIILLLNAHLGSDWYKRIDVLIKK